jgi:hypothetical protein
VGADIGATASAGAGAMRGDGEVDDQEEAGIPLSKGRALASEGVEPDAGTEKPGGGGREWDGEGARGVEE